MRHRSATRALGAVAYDSPWAHGTWRRTDRQLRPSYRDRSIREAKLRVENHAGLGGPGRTSASGRCPFESNSDQQEATN
jgi:hypothetical protein